MHDATEAHWNTGHHAGKRSNFTCVYTPAGQGIISYLISCMTNQPLQVLQTYKVI